MITGQRQQQQLELLQENGGNNGVRCKALLLLKVNVPASSFVTADGHKKNTTRGEIVFNFLLQEKLSTSLSSSTAALRAPPRPGVLKFYQHTVDVNSFFQCLFLHPCVCVTLSLQ